MDLPLESVYEIGTEYQRQEKREGLFRARERERRDVGFRQLCIWKKDPYTRLSHETCLLHVRGGMANVSFDVLQQINVAA